MKRESKITLALIILLCLPAILCGEWIRVAVIRSIPWVPGGEVVAWFDGNPMPPAQHLDEYTLVYDFYDAPHDVEGLGVNARVIFNNVYYFDWILYDPDNLPPHLFIYIME